MNGLWKALDYQYTAATILPELVSPTPARCSVARRVTFSWITNGVAVNYWILRVGTSLGGNQLHYSGTLSGTTLSRTVANLPTGGETIFVRLQYYVNGTWKTLDYHLREEARARFLGSVLNNLTFVLPFYPSQVVQD